MRISPEKFLTYGFIYPLLLIFLPAHFSAAAPGRGITVRVRILEKFRPDVIMIENGICVGATCGPDGKMEISRGKLRGMQTPVVITAREGKEILISVPGKLSRKYRGGMEITCEENALKIINVAGMEDYLRGVVGSEVSFYGKAAEEEFLKAQAVISRTYAYFNIARHKDGGYDFCDLTHCQAYRGMETETEEIIRAVSRTENMVLTFGGGLAEPYYHSTCGGTTGDVSSVWKGQHLPYLVPVKCTFSGVGLCSHSPHYRWDCRIGQDELSEALFGRKGVIYGIRVTGYSASGRATGIEVAAPDGKHETDGESFRITVGRKLGWNMIKSSVFTVEKEGNVFHFRGAGLGHGVGLCQWGANELAKRGFSSEKILEFYFRGTEIRDVSSLPTFYTHE